MKCINKECKNRCDFYIDEDKVPIGTTVTDITGDGSDCLVCQKLKQNKTERIINDNNKTNSAKGCISVIDEKVLRDRMNFHPLILSKKL